MSLLQNISSKNQEPIDRMGDTAEWWPSQLAWQMNKYIGSATISRKSGVPDGYAPPYDIQMSIKEGGMSSFGGIIGVGNTGVASYLTTAIAMVAAAGKIRGRGEIKQADTSLSLLVKLLADLGQIVGSGEITNASVLKAIANMTANSSYALTGEGKIVDSPLNLIAWCSNLSRPIVGEGAITATLKGWCDMMAEISATGDILTAQKVAEAVWAAIAADNNVSTTMGEKLNDAGGASNPWSVELPDAYTGNQAGKVLDDIKKKANMIPGLY